MHRSIPQPRLQPVPAERPRQRVDQQVRRIGPRPRPGGGPIAPKPGHPRRVPPAQDSQGRGLIRGNVLPGRVPYDGVVHHEDRPVAGLVRWTGLVQSMPWRSLG
uniref:(northern house mosquito) hypothetical protein n=1 Tax=Culex pipiens TaxID=7175 RepID=A0A8D8E4R9_CULPI